MNTRRLPYNKNSTDIFLSISHLDGCIWLDSGKPASNMGRYDILSALPSQTIECGSEHLEQELNQKLNQHQLTSELPFCGGWIGYLSYSGDSRFSWYDWAIIVDHELQISTLFFVNTCPNKTRNQIHKCLQAPPESKHEYQCSRFQADLSSKEYLSAVQVIQNYLRAGDCYQVNYAQRFSADFSGSESLAYLQLRKAVPSPFSAYIKMNTGAILSISPERFIQVKNRDALTQPIKGTIARGETSDEDNIQKALLRRSEKDLAENVMIVDLLRNDFNRNCNPFSVKAPELFAIQSFSNVHHLVSTIIGQIKSHISHIAFVQSCFPGGSITGAPKKRAMEIIDELEPFERGIYCGAIGYLSCNQKTDFNIAIRTLRVENTKIYAWAGGGIVLDSDPNQEYQESLTKIERLLRAVETS